MDKTPLTREQKVDLLNKLLTAAQKLRSDDAESGVDYELIKRVHTYLGIKPRVLSDDNTEILINAIESVIDTDFSDTTFNNIMLMANSNRGIDVVLLACDFDLSEVPYACSTGIPHTP